MTPEQILEHPPKILTPKQRQSYFDKGFLLVEISLGRSGLSACWPSPTKWSSAAAA